MAPRSPVQNLWNTTRVNLARLGRLFAETGNLEDMIFDIRDPKDRWRSNDRERRAADPRKS
jgi:hypothetical protein